MKIGDVSKAYGALDAQTAAVRRIMPAKPAARTDKVSISASAKDFQAVMRGLKSAPDVREDRVAELSEKYESGTAGVDARAIAERMLASGVARRL